ncbi:hypothetical protein [Kitasatospora sp. CB01950]|uniref:hypothetical protein n=1 Tax=Kitasatospora sp. CB01950 TaxID=1703930 RepID=UPI00093896E7|nr:hypothetical protein [Kitasatospora sp. CB01950]OKJ09298.1 hypothetical protein AMK19_18325 [Kitasatospora sp. CB01950]
MRERLRLADRIVDPLTHVPGHGRPDFAGGRVAAADSAGLRMTWCPGWRGCCDRFLLVDGVLKPVREIRYRRSRSKDRP